ncbi:hypothetical protein [Pseudonocardia alaniniphila]|uniref:LysM domain-containing protein n=1 Tax=Pseudonocardia alaniniphila TaxID=75291 RepID=A0ABS9TS89_9PSEU|nr:hypothetical protein [Pseudonocardia alaniniphila]MCH6171419.1 hypothetical protein [Pseudonocardia alaniniphila]
MNEHDEIGRPAEIRSGGGRLQTSGDGRVATLTPPGVQWSRFRVVEPDDRPDGPGDAAAARAERRFRAADRRRVGGSAWHGRRRGSRGPRPVRPVAVPIIVRPAALPRPAWPAVRLLSSGQRLLARRVRGGGAGLPLRIRVRRALAATGLTVVAAAVVVGLGQLGGVVAESRADVGGGPAVAVATTVTVGPEATVWEVARGVAPTASGPQLAALTERIVTTNSLTSVQLHPGQVLRVPQG